MYWSTAVATVAQQIQIRTSTDRTRVVVRIHPGSQGFLWGQNCTLHMLLFRSQSLIFFFILGENTETYVSVESDDQP